MNAHTGFRYDPTRSDRRPKSTQGASTSKKWDSGPETDKWLAERHFDSATPTTLFRIDGWLAERGTSVWYGAGSTGKTQLLLWMSCMIASRPEHRAPTWLGGTINGSGHILILTAEDTHSQIVSRLRDIVLNTMHQDSAAARETCSRIHVMPFISMTEDEFKHPNASLFRYGEDRVWRQSEVMEEIRHYITAWNERHNDPQDQIVGVVLDSATSMAGFDSMEGEATTNFFFYLNRLCEALGIFFTVIGHVPKAAFVPQKDPFGTAASRLRGVAMWTTAPRMAVEVRVLQEWNKKPDGQERKDLRTAYPDLKRQDFLVVYAAKANLLDVCREPRYVIRTANGAFEEVNPSVNASVEDRSADPVLKNEQGLRRKKSKPGAAKNASKKTPPDIYYARGTDLVLQIMHITYPDLCPGQRIVADRVMTMIKSLHEAKPLDARHLVTSASGGGEGARPGSIGWHFHKLEEQGILVRRNRRHFFVALPITKL